MDLADDDLVEFFDAVLPHLDESQRRLVGGGLAMALGRGGKTLVAVASGMSRNTVSKGQRELEAGVEPSERVRASGGGDRPATEKQPGLMPALDRLIDPATAGTPMSPLRWTSKSTYRLAEELSNEGFDASAELVRRLLHQLGYSLQAPAKVKAGTITPRHASAEPPIQ